MRNFGHVEEGKVGSLGDLQLWSRILKLSANYKYALTAAVFLSLAVTGATLGLPYLMQKGIDSWILAEQLDKTVRIQGLFEVTVQYGYLIILVFFASFLQVLLLEWIGQSVMHIIRQKLFSHVTRLDLTFLNSQPTGKLVTRLTNDIQNMHEMFTSVMVTLFNDFLRMAGILALLFFMNVRLAMVMTLFIPIAFGITYLFSKLARERFSAIRSQLAKMNSFLQESISGMSIIQLFSRQSESTSNFEDLSSEYLKRCLRQIRLFGTFMPITELLGSVAIAIILWYGGSEVIGQRLSLGELVAFLAYMRLFFQPLRELSQKYSIVQSAMASAERIFQLLDRENGIAEPQDPYQPESVSGEVVFNQVSFAYKDGEEILRDMSLTVPAGKTVALVGTTGSGKSTLINLLLRFYEPQKGTITLDGRDVADYPTAQLRTYVGVVLQDVYLLQDSLLANINMDTSATRDQVREILHQTGMKRFVERLPDGLDTIIGEGGHELSTGEKQLLSFARVLCRNPSVLVLDEATAAIDTESEDILEESIQNGFKDKTSIIIAHRLSTIRRAHLIAVMHEGKIVEYGTHNELISNKKFYHSLVVMDQAETASMSSGSLAANTPSSK